jgi:hypothetical protein
MDRVGDYEILGALGAGGMGQVLKVRNVITDRIEAMKVLLPNLAGRQELVDRFLREIKVLAGLDHPNIAALRTAFTFNDRLVMVMEFVEGTTLAALLERGPIPPGDAVRYFDQVLQALSYAHSRNVIHRDIKPANIMLTPEGLVKLMDFGIARSSQDRSLTATGTTLGSLYYMSPEQVKGEAVDARSDLYSLGVSLYEMVTGQRPFDATSDFSILSAHLQQAPKPPMDLRHDVPAALNAVILMALAKDPSQRFQTAEAFRNALSTVVSPASPQPQATAAIAVPQATFGPASMAAAASATAVMQGKASLSPAAAAITDNNERNQAQGAYFPGRETAPNRRGLWVAVGSLMVLGILVASAVYVPHSSHTAAAGTQNSPANPPVTAAPGSAAESLGKPGAARSTRPIDAKESAAQPSATAAQLNTPPLGLPNSDEGAPPSASTSGRGTLKPLSRRAFATRQASSQSTTPSTLSSAAPAPLPAQIPSSGTGTVSPGSGTTQASVNAAEIEEVEHDYDLLLARASTVNDSLKRMEQQQAANGLGLRGDMASAQDRMSGDLERVQRALRQNDAAGARKYMAQAETEVERLEKFLGR